MAIEFDTLKSLFNLDREKVKKMNREADRQTQINQIRYDKLRNEGNIMQDQIEDLNEKINTIGVESEAMKSNNPL